MDGVSNGVGVNVAVDGSVVGVKLEVGYGVLVATVGVAVGIAVVVGVGVSVGVAVWVAVGVGAAVGVFVIVGGVHCVGVGSSVVFAGKVAVAALKVGVGVRVPTTVLGVRPLGASARAAMPMQ